MPAVNDGTGLLPFGMLMPGRRGAVGVNGLWTATGSGGSTLPANPSYSSRTGNTPAEYKATQSIEFLPGFESREGDSFEAFITTESSDGGTSNGVALDGSAYRYGFNGKENDNEVEGEGNQQDYGMRIYDPRLGRFLSVDPLTSKYPALTPYQFASNRPIDGIDLDGLEHYNYRLIRQKDNTTKLELLSVKSAKPWYGGAQYSHHHITYNGTVYHFQGSSIDPFANSFKSLVPFVNDPDKAIKAGIVQTDQEIGIDWYIFNLQQSVFELAGANTTFALKNGSLKVYRAGVGEAATNDYRGTFFEANPGLRGKVVVHHAIEQQIEKRYPGAFTKAQINSLENLRGINLSDNDVLHLSVIRRLWNSFYKENQNATTTQIINQATKIDREFGSLFNPTVTTGPTGTSSGGFNFSRGLILITGLEEKGNMPKNGEKKP